MNYSIIATLGPASSEPAIWQALLASGATGFRLNTSHLTIPELAGWLERLAPFMRATAPQAAIVLDLQGSKWRLGRFPADALAEGQMVELACADTSSTVKVLPVPHPDFFQAAQLSSGEIVLNDAKIRLAVEMVGETRLTARVVQGGEIAARKGITYTASPHRHERLSEQDREILAQTRGIENLQYAISYVRDGLEMACYRAGMDDLRLIAKLERRPALDDAVEIARIVDEVWLCRGDLGAELGLRGMAEAAAWFSKLVGSLQAPVLLAGQVLEHMTGCATPTRSEISCIYNVLEQGYQGVVLSDETAIGKFPLESCQAAALFRGSF
ncbi:MAG: pyruvate kinase [Anaerolineales bacterium]|nr:pyruvate kinase [Anaerolineales bacterium]